MEHLLSKRIKGVPTSFIREILKVSTQPGIISFAGGLPNSKLFPIDKIEQACSKVLKENGEKALQYSSSEGDAELREWIAQRYKIEQGLEISNKASKYKQKPTNNNNHNDRNTFRVVDLS